MIKTILFKKLLIIFNSSNQTATRGNPKLIQLRMPIDGNRCSRSIGIRNRLGVFKCAILLYVPVINS